MLDAVLGGALRLEVRQLAEVVFESVAGAAIPSGPEGGFGTRHTAGERHLLIVVGRARDHVRMMVDVLHNYTSFTRGDPCTPLTGSLRSRGPVAPLRSAHCLLAGTPAPRSQV